MSTRLAVNSSTDSLSVELFPLEKSYIGGEEEKTLPLVSICLQSSKHGLCKWDDYLHRHN